MLSPQERCVNTVFQSYALFPHMTVFDNVAFGLRMSRTPRTDLKERVMETLQVVRMVDLAQRKPHQLSGGQQQRVAIARAVVNRPRVLLLDEPLNALDYKLRKEMQIELKAIQRRLGITFLFVTHDQEEALSMSDRVVVMREGIIEQIGTPREVYENPINLFVAGFVGEANIFEGRVLERLSPETIRADLEGLVCLLRDEGRFVPGERIKVLLRPEDLRLEDLVEAGPVPGRFTGQVVERNYKGMTLDSIITLENGKRIQASEFFDEDDPSFDYSLGDRVTVGWVEGWEVVLPHEEKPEPL
jgi:spermidine/putrescine transport system ATP-binding protein